MTVAGDSKDRERRNKTGVLEHKEAEASNAKFKKRAFSQLDSAEDDEEPPPAKKRTTVKMESKAKDEAPTRKNTPAQRLIILNFESLTGKRHKWPLTQDIVGRIPIYAAMLAEASRGTKRRIIIEDSKRRDEECMTDIIEYLTTGELPAVMHTRSNGSRIDTQRLLHLCNVAVALGVTEFADKAVVKLTAQTSLDDRTFCDIAYECCAARSQMDVSAKAPAGKWLRKYITTHLAQLEASGDVASITEKGGKLAGILVEVLVDERNEGGSGR